jgi:AraC-like DNA-binding protein
VGHFPRKTHLLDRQLAPAYPFCVSIISEGDGICCVNGVDIDLPIPCVFLQPPGSHLRYGPRTYWTETWWQFRFSERDFRARWNLPADGKLVHEVGDISAVRDLIGHIVTACRRPHARFAADRIDMLSELVFLEAFAGSAPQRVSSAGDESVLSVERYLSEHFTKAVKIDSIAERFGVSKSNFYRRWEKHFAQTPAQLLLNLRMEHARRALLETPHDIKQVALDAGFSSPHYFSRAFNARFGMSPSEYRTMNRAPESHTKH